MLLGVEVDADRVQDLEGGLHDLRTDAVTGQEDYAIGHGGGARYQSSVASSGAARSGLVTGHKHLLSAYVPMALSARPNPGVYAGRGDFAGVHRATSTTVPTPEPSRPPPPDR